MLGRTALLLGLLLCASAFAEPRQWDTDGLPVRAASAIIDYSQATREDGSTLIVWAQPFESVPVVMGQLLSPDGEPLWEENGRMIAQGLYKAGFPTAVAVDGGWAIAWFDAEVFTWCDRLDGGWCIRASIHAIKINDEGAPLWPSGLQGVQINDAAIWYGGNDFSIFESGTGCIVVWHDNSDQFSQRVNGQGQLEWADVLYIEGNRYSNSDLKSDGRGGLIWAWSQIANGDTMLRANRITRDGVPLWNGREGLVVRTSNLNFYDITVEADGTGGAFVLWETSETSTPHYALRIGAEGEVLWDNPVALTEARSDQRVLSLATSIDGETSDGLIVLFQRTSPNYRLMGQKVMLNGDLPWWTVGEAICTSSDNEEYYEHTAVRSDNSGGMIALYDRYQDWPDYGHYLTVSRVSSDGSRPWGEGCGTTIDTVLVFSYWSGLYAPSITNNALQMSWFDNNQYDVRIKTQRASLATGDLEYPNSHVLVESDGSEPWDPVHVAIGGGATVTVWTTAVEGRQVPYFQIQDVFGERLFGREGMPLCVNEDGTPVAGDHVALCADGSGGFFAVFKLNDQTSPYLSRVVHLNGAGQHIGDPAGETLIQTQTYADMYDATCVADGAGGCYIGYSLYDPNYRIVSVTTRVNAECVALWTNPVVVSVAERDVYTKGVLPSIDGSCLVVYAPTTYNNSDVKAMQISSTGTVLWTSLLNAGSNREMRSATASTDHQNGAIVLWSARFEELNRYKLFAQRVNAAGDPMWGTDGIAMYESQWEPQYVSMDVDPVGNMTCAWVDFSGTDDDITAQRLSADGAILWGDSGLAVCRAPNYQSRPDVVSMSDNEVYVFWEDHRNSTFVWSSADIYATHLDARGRIGGDSYWQPNGSVVCDILHSQRVPSAVNDGMGGATLVFLDQRGDFDSYYSIYSQRLFDPIFTDADETSLLPTEFSLSQNYPNPFNPETVIEFALPTISLTTLKVYDVTGREAATLVNGPLAAGNHRVTFDASQLSSGVYFYTLRSENASLTKKMVLIR